MAYGSPDTLENVGKYYTNIRGGRVPSYSEVETLKNRYIAIGGKSPLLGITLDQARMVQEYLSSSSSAKFRIYVGMKHWEPFIEESIKKMHNDGINNAIGMVLAPHHSSMSISEYERRILSVQGNLKIDFVQSWNRDHGFLCAVAGKIRKAAEKFQEAGLDGIQIVFTAHSLPEKIVYDGDDYVAQLLESCIGIAKILDLKRWRLAYQSAPRCPKEKWLGPDLKETLSELMDDGKNDILICPIGFVSDHLEVLYDIDIEAKALADSHDARLIRTESLNTSPDFIAAIGEIIKSRQPNFKHDTSLT